MFDVSDVRKRVRQAIDRARRAAAARRAQADTAGRHYERFLQETAAPVFVMLAAALKAEGHLFQVFTPPDTLRLASERSGDDFIEVILDTSHAQPVVLGRISRSRGRRVTTTERPIREAVPIEDLTPEHVLQFLLTEIEPFVER